MTDDPFRLCIDLNVWVSNFLAIGKNLGGTASQAIVGAVQSGRSGVGPIQLVVSHAMLTRLLDVLTRKGATLDSATQFISLIESISRLGPSYEFPHVVLGGGFIPTADAKTPLHAPYDSEDGRVMDAAIAGRADALVTANFRDFTERHDSIITPGRVHVRHMANHDLTITQPKETALWLQSGKRPAPPSGADDARHGDLSRQ